MQHTTTSIRPRVVAIIMVCSFGVVTQAATTKAHAVGALNRGLSQRANE